MDKEKDEEHTEVDPELRALEKQCLKNLEDVRQTRAESWHDDGRVLHRHFKY